MIVPALLTDKKDELTRMMEVCAAFTEFVQVDLMDGVFVPSRSIVPSDLQGFQPAVRCEAHLMVADPLTWLQPLYEMGVERFIHHFEIDKDHSEILGSVKARNLQTGLAINPETSLEDFDSLLNQVDVVLFLSVHPGFYGSPFIPEVLDKIRRFKEEHPQKEVGIDGGIKQDNLLEVKAAGVNYVCVGSAILKAAAPQRAYETLIKLFKSG